MQRIQNILNAIGPLLTRLNNSLNVNTGSITAILTLIGIVIAYRSCKVTRDMENDQRQLTALNNIVTKVTQSLTQQQDMLKNQQQQLSELNSQSKLISEEVTESSVIKDNTLNFSKNLEKQLLILNHQQSKALKVSSNERKLNIMKLNFDLTRMFNANEEPWTYQGNLEKQIIYVNEFRSILITEAANPILLENDSLLTKWNLAINDANFAVQILGLKNPDISFVKLQQQDFEEFYNRSMNVAIGTLNFVRKIYDELHLRRD